VPAEALMALRHGRRRQNPPRNRSAATPWRAFSNPNSSPDRSGALAALGAGRCRGPGSLSRVGLTRGAEHPPPVPPPRKPGLRQYPGPPSVAGASLSLARGQRLPPAGRAGRRAYALPLVGHWLCLASRERSGDNPRGTQLCRVMAQFVRYYHDDRCHLGLEKDTPELRMVTPQPSPAAGVVALPRVGGLQHRYEWREAA
jgi:hypothetical protein